MKLLETPKKSMKNYYHSPRSEIELLTYKAARSSAEFELRGLRRN